MNRDTLTISETPWLAIIVSIMLPIALVGWVQEASWVHVEISSPTIKNIVFVVFIIAEIYLLIRGVWPRKIVVNLKQQQITITAYCPYIYSPIQINISEIKKIRVGDYNSFNASGRMFNLIIEKKDGAEIVFGDWNSPEQKKYEQWRDEIANFAGINNITSDYGVKH